MASRNVTSKHLAFYKSLFAVLTNETLRLLGQPGTFWQVGTSFLNYFNSLLSLPFRFNRQIREICWILLRRLSWLRCSLSITNIRRERRLFDIVFLVNFCDLKILFEPLTGEGLVVWDMWSLWSLKNKVFVLFADGIIRKRKALEIFNQRNLRGLVIRSAKLMRCWHVWVLIIERIRQWSEVAVVDVTCELDKVI